MKDYPIVTLAIAMWVAFIAVGATVVLLMRNRGRFSVSTLLMATAALALFVVAVKMAAEFPK